MLLDLAAYLLVGGAMGFLWNRVELEIAPLRRVLPSLAAFTLAWPALVLGAIVIAGLWTPVWRKSHAEDHPAGPQAHTAPPPPFAGTTAEPTAL